MISIEGLSIDLAEFHLQEISLEVRAGEYLVLLGPTGAGKTVLLECLAGFHRPRAGRLVVSGEDMTDLPPEERNLAYVPQDYALFPNLSVKENVAYGLRARRARRAEIEQKVEAMLTRLGISHLRGRLPLHLSGGERQRVALGRALVTEPRVLLLDEPLSALDESLRLELARDLRRLQQDCGRTFLHVCHSLEEASEVADRIALLHQGRIVQVAPLEELLRSPACLFVARFTGTRNLLPGVAAAREDGAEVRVGETLVLRSRAPQNGAVTVAMRPEALELVSPATDGEAGADNLIRGRLVRQILRPGHLELEVEIGELRLIATSRSCPASPGAPVLLRVDPGAVLLFPAA